MAAIVLLCTLNAVEKSICKFNGSSVVAGRAKGNDFCVLLWPSLFSLACMAALLFYDTETGKSYKAYRGQWVQWDISFKFNRVHPRISRPGGNTPCITSEAPNLSE